MAGLKWDIDTLDEMHKNLCIMTKKLCMLLKAKQLFSLFSLNLNFPISLFRFFDIYIGRKRADESSQSPIPGVMPGVKDPERRV